MKKRVIAHFKNNWKTWALLILIIALASALRFTGIDWDQGAHLHPDERFLAMVTNDITWPNSTAEYFDTAQSPLNPANKGKTFFVYGTFPVFLTKLVGDLTGNGHYTAYTLTGRAISAIFDIFSIIVVFLIAMNLFDKKTGLLSAFFLAITVVHIQHSHFSVVDLYSTFFIVLSFYLLLLYVRTGKITYAVLLGASLGFGMASKINAILLAPLVAFGLLAVGINLLESNLKGKSTPRRAIFLSARTIILTGILIIIVAGLLFRILQPYAFAGPLSLSFSENFVHSLNEVTRLTSKASASGYVPSFQWVNRPFYFLLENLAIWGIGMPLSIICSLGLLYGIYKLFRKEYSTLFLLMWVSFILIYQSLQFVKPQRYALPAIPFLMILGAHFVVTAMQAACNKFKKKHVLYVTYGLVAVLVLSCLFWPLAFTNVYRATHPRIAASSWVYENVPANSTVTVEPWDDGIPFHKEFMPPSRYYKSVTLELLGPNDEKHITKLSEQLSGADYVFITSGRNYKVLPRLGNQQFISRYYQLLFSGELGFSLEKRFINYPSLLGIEINDSDAEESFTVYDHPEVLIFKNIGRFDHEEIFRLITNEET